MTKEPLLPLPKDKTFAFATEIPILMQHINYGNHLGHDSLVPLLHEARVRFLKAKGLSEKELIMTELSVQYKSEAFHGEVLEFQVDMVLRNLFFCDFLYRVKEKISKRLVAEAVTTLVFFDYQTRKIAKTPQSFIDA